MWESILRPDPLRSSSSTRGGLTATNADHRDGAGRHLHRPSPVPASACSRGRHNTWIAQSKSRRSPRQSGVRVSGSIETRSSRAVTGASGVAPDGRGRRFRQGAAGRPNELHGPGGIEGDVEPALVHRPVMPATEQHQVVQRSRSRRARPSEVPDMRGAPCATARRDPHRGLRPPAFQGGRPAASARTPPLPAFPRERTGSSRGASARPRPAPMFPRKRAGRHGPALIGDYIAESSPSDAAAHCHLGKIDVLLDVHADVPESP